MNAYKEIAVIRLLDTLRLNLLLTEAVNRCNLGEEGEVTADEKECIANYVELGYLTLYKGINEHLVMEKLPDFI